MTKCRNLGELAQALTAHAECPVETKWLESLAFDGKGRGLDWKRPIDEARQIIDGLCDHKVLSTRSGESLSFRTVKQLRTEIRLMIAWGCKLGLCDPPQDAHVVNAARGRVTLRFSGETRATFKVQEAKFRKLYRLPPEGNLHGVPSGASSHPRPRMAISAKTQAAVKAHAKNHKGYINPFKPAPVTRLDARFSKIINSAYLATEGLTVLVCQLMKEAGHSELQEQVHSKATSVLDAFQKHHYTAEVYLRQLEALVATLAQTNRSSVRNGMPLLPGSGKNGAAS